MYLCIQTKWGRQSGCQVKPSAFLTNKWTSGEKNTSGFMLWIHVEAPVKHIEGSKFPPI